MREAKQKRRPNAIIEVITNALENKRAESSATKIVASVVVESRGVQPSISVNNALFYMSNQSAMTLAQSIINHVSS